MEVKFNRFDKTAIADIVHDYFLDVDTIYWNKENNLITMLYFKDSGGSIGAGKIIIKNVILNTRKSLLLCGIFNLWK